jgi:hypothetical protein
MCCEDRYVGPLQPSVEAERDARCTLARVRLARMDDARRLKVQRRTTTHVR